MRINNMAQVRVFFTIAPATRWLALFGMMLLILLLALPGGAHAAKAKTKKFDHDNTGFVLTGAHVDAACDSCHIRGIFKGIPKTCDGCHAKVTQITATKKTESHIKSTDRCDDCHIDSAWKPAKVDHTAVFGVCKDCHGDGKLYAPTKPTGHTGAQECENCHRTTTWSTSGFNHAGIVDKCDSCHNGVTVKSKKPDDAVHTNVTNVSRCENCHKSFTVWAPPQFDHSYISSQHCVNCHKPGGVVKTSRPATTASGTAHVADDNCESCHNTSSWKLTGAFNHAGITGNCVSCHGGKKPTDVVHNASNISNSTVCEDCHKSFTVWPPTAAFNHAYIIGTQCVNCHTPGTTPPHTSRPATTSTGAAHPADNNCYNCHTNTSSWKIANVHAGVTGNCVACHSAKKPTDVVHNNVSNVSVCETCHTSFTVWPPTSFNHANTTAACVNCHRPGTTPPHTNRPALTSSGAQHPVDDNCANCHNTGSWSTGGTFNHSGITNNCVSCHSAKKPADVVHNATNISNSTVCENCHTSFTVWPPTSFNHTYIATSQCVNCHTTGTTPPHTSRPATTSSGATHPNDNNCQNCHTSTSTWKIGSFDHAGITNNCVSCHLTKKPTDTEHSNFTTPNICEDCHKSFMTWPINTLNHSLVLTTHCVTCHSPGHKTITTRPLKKADGTAHPIDDNCENCHQSAGTTWIGAQGKPSNHATLTNGCSTCHTADKSKLGKHMPTPNDNCENCHRPDAASFSTWTWTHSSSQTSSYGCYQCHDGTVPHADGRSGTHIAIIGTSGCSNCHKSTSVWTVSVVDHSQTSGTCVSCHKPNNPPVKTSKASDPRVGGHIVVSDDCTSCHKNQNPGGWATHIMDHNQLSGGNSSCASVGCHNTVKATVNHFPTTPSNAECGPTCHSPTASTWGNAKYTHDGNTNCNSCHGRTMTYYNVVTSAAKYDPNHMTDLETKYSLQCSVCHTGTSTGNFANAVNYFSKHTTNPEMSGHNTGCTNCHKTGVAANQIKGYNNLGYPKCTSGSCAACHKSSNYNKEHSGDICARSTCAGSGCHSHSNGNNITSSNQ